MVQNIRASESARVRVLLCIPLALQVSIVWSLAMSRSIRNYFPVKTDFIGCLLDQNHGFSSQVYMYIRTAKKFRCKKYFHRRSRPTKNFQYENFYYESLITQKFPDLQYIIIQTQQVSECVCVCECTCVCMIVHM